VLSRTRALSRVARVAPVLGSLALAATPQTSSRNVQLLRRQWEILDLDGSVVEVEGAGVVGETPHLAARTGWHRYSSWTRSSSYGGTMRGSFLMVDADAPHPDSTAFHVTVAPFGLVVPNEWCLRPPPPQQ